MSANHTISVSFAPITYTITPTAGANGTISPSSAVTVNSGGSQTFSFTPATGYQVSSVLVDGTAVTTASSYTFSSVSASHTISVSFAPISYTITPTAGANGTISPSSPVTVNYGGSQTFSFTPATGYQVSSVLVDGTAVTTASSYTFSSVSANHTISVSFAPITYTITAHCRGQRHNFAFQCGDGKLRRKPDVFIHSGDRLPGFKRPGRRYGSNNRIELHLLECERQSHYQRLFCIDHLHHHAHCRGQRHDFAFQCGDRKLRRKPDVFIHSGHRLPGFKRPGRRYGSNNRIELHLLECERQSHYQRLFCIDHLHHHAHCRGQRHDFAFRCR